MQQQSWIIVVRIKEHFLVNQGQMGIHCRQLTEAKVHWLGIWDVDEILAIGGGVESSSRTDVPVPSLVDYLGRLPAEALVLAIPRFSFLNADVTLPPSADQAVALRGALAQQKVRVLEGSLANLWSAVECTHGGAKGALVDG